MSYEDDLRKLKEIKKSGCVAFTIMDSVTYYAVNGIEKGTPGETNVSRALDNMYKTSKKIRCVSNDSYTAVNPKMFGHYVLFQDNVNKLFTSLDTSKEIYIEDIILPMKYNDNYDNRNWCCCERKIIGYLHDNEMIKGFHNVMELYVSKRPCLLCVPMVAKVYYLDDNLYIKSTCYKRKMVNFNTMKITI